MSLRTLAEHYLYHKLPEGLVDLDKKGLIRAVVGGIQDRLEDLRYYALRYQAIMDMATIFPEVGSQNVVSACYTDDQGKLITKSVTITDDTPRESSYRTTEAWLAALKAWTEAELNISLESIYIGNDALRSVDTELLGFLANNVGAVIYKTQTPLSAQERQRVLSSYFARQKLKGTAQSFSLLGRLMNFGSVEMIPLWGRVSPRLPSDVGNSANDADFSSQPEVTPTAEVSSAYDPLDYTDGQVIYSAPPVAGLDIIRTSPNFYPTAVNGSNPYVKIVVGEGTPGHPTLELATSSGLTYYEKTYALTGGGYHTKATAVLVPGPKAVTAIDGTGNYTVRGTGTIACMVGSGTQYFTKDSTFVGLTGVTTGYASNNTVAVYAVTDTGHLVNHVQTSTFAGSAADQYAIVTGTVTVKTGGVSIFEGDLAGFISDPRWPLASVTTDSDGNQFIQLHVYGGQSYSVTAGAGSVIYRGATYTTTVDSPAIINIEAGTVYEVVGNLGVAVYGGICYSGGTTATGITNFEPLTDSHGQLITDSAPVVIKDYGVARMVVEALAEGDSFNGLVIGITCNGTCLAHGQTGHAFWAPAYGHEWSLSSIKYRTSYYDLFLALDFNRFIADYGDQAPTMNAGLRSNALADPSISLPDGLAVSPYRPWAGGRFTGGLAYRSTRHQAKPTPYAYGVSGRTINMTRGDREIDQTLLIDAGLQAAQYFNEVGAATRFPRRLLFGFSLADDAIYAAFKNYALLTTYTDTAQAIITLTDHPGPTYTGVLELRYTVGDTTTVVPLTGEIDPVDPKLVNYVGTNCTVTYRPATGTAADTLASGVAMPMPLATPTALLVNQLYYNFVNPIVGQKLIAHWFVRESLTIRSEPLASDKPDNVGYQNRPEDSLSAPIYGFYDEAPRGIVAGGNQVNADTYAGATQPAPESAELTVVDQSGLAYRVVGVDNRTTAYPNVSFTLEPYVEANSVGFQKQARRALGTCTGGICEIGSASGVLVGDLRSFATAAHYDGLVGWFPLNSHPSDPAVIADHSAVASLQTVSTLNPTDRVWTVSRGWYHTVRPAFSLTSSESRAISEALSLSFWLRPPSADNSSSTIIAFGSYLEASGYIKPGFTYLVSESSVTYNGATVAVGDSFIGVSGISTYTGNGVVTRATGVSDPASPAICAKLNKVSIDSVLTTVVDWYVKGSDGVVALAFRVPLTVNEFNFVAITLDSTGAYYGVGSLSTPMSFTHHNWATGQFAGFDSEAQAIAITGYPVQSYGLQDVRLWNKLKTNAELNHVRLPALNLVETSTKLPYFTTVPRGEAWTLAVTPAGLAYPSAAWSSTLAKLENLGIGANLQLSLTTGAVGSSVKLIAQSVSPAATAVIAEVIAGNLVTVDGNETVVGTVTDSVVTLDTAGKSYVGTMVTGLNPATLLPVEIAVSLPLDAVPLSVSYQYTTTQLDRELRARLVRYNAAGQYDGSNDLYDVGLGIGAKTGAVQQLEAQAYETPGTGKFIASQVNNCFAKIWVNGDAQTATAHGGSTTGSNASVYEVSVKNGLLSARKNAVLRPGNFNWPQLTTEQREELGIEFYDTTPILDYGTATAQVSVRQGVGAEIGGTIQELDTVNFSLAAPVCAVVFSSLDYLVSIHDEVVLCITTAIAGFSPGTFYGRVTNVSAPSPGYFRVTFKLTGVLVFGNGTKVAKTSDWALRWSANEVYTKAASAGVFARQPCYLYASGTDAYAAAGLILYSTWSNQEGSVSPYAARATGGPLYFTLPVGLAAGSYTLEIEAGNLGRLDTALEGFTVEITLESSGVSVFTAGVLAPGPNNYRATTAFEFELATGQSLANPWDLAINWTNYLDVTALGCRRQLVIYAIRVVKHEDKLHQFNFTGATLSVVAASNTTPIVVETSEANHLVTGDRVTITGVVGNTAANVVNGYVTVVDSHHLSLDGTVGNGTYASGGTITWPISQLDLSQLTAQTPGGLMGQLDNTGVTAAYTHEGNTLLETAVGVSQQVLGQLVTGTTLNRKESVKYTRFTGAEAYHPVPPDFLPGGTTAVSAAAEAKYEATPGLTSITVSIPS